MNIENELTEVEKLLLMAACAQGIGPKIDLNSANTHRIVGQVLRWLGTDNKDIRLATHGISGEAEEVQNQLGLSGRGEEVYRTLVCMTRQEHPDGGWRPAERPGAPLFEGSGNWGVPGDPAQPPAHPRFNSCRLTADGEVIATRLLKQDRDRLR